MMVKRIETLDGPRYYQKGTTRWAYSSAELHKKQNRLAKPIQVPMDTSGFPLPKPGQKEKSQPKDGRLIESPAKYSRTKKLMWLHQNGRCLRVKDGKVCGRFMPTPSGSTNC